jgi:hypothetical protein
MGVQMATKRMLRPILDNEALTRGLGDAEARVLVEWLVGEAEILAEMDLDLAQLTWEVECLCERARAISRFVILWCYRDSWGPACQLAATERFSWPLPSTPMDPCELMEQILGYEANLMGA